MIDLHDRLLRELEDIQRADPTAIPCRRANGTAWITGTPKDTWYAQLHCEKCPAKAACGGYALAADEPAGVWGGLTVAQRKQLNAQRRKATAPKPLDSRDTAA
ncbi:WhiB family transcriptional regulator [Kocuria sp. p3-SID1433]|uniref:WhiB family transcriptional regulator n=1 Tax=unclassified Kocuria TaxID=2649579 RepID=UPI0021A59B1A|nr:MULTISPECIES: WhiB family transcriptional regulator [unclassified Kocuria]MCT1601887.1 WhiB family transcriptional regulator [Kocuria sp. p3-SID1428]MCT2179570.1 WhiB family transcriptional regulator [Kocuria sp. p3-SID1433]